VTTTEYEQMTATEAASGHATHHGPTPREYVQIAAALFALTAAEISTYFVDFGPIGIPLLVILMAIKFVLVANFFMHLKFDSRLYTRLLYAGLTLALFLYAAALVIILFASAPSL
jgi:cytochrome c oxidase subunit IV